MVEQYVSGLSRTVHDKKKNRQEILSLAGSWAILSEKDFEEIRAVAKETGATLFSRSVEI